jgi:hypothetical protein
MVLSMENECSVIVTRHTSSQVSMSRLMIESASDGDPEQF